MESVTIANVTGPTDDLRALIAELDAELAADYPPGARHGIAFEAIFEPHIRFFVARRDGVAVGCGGVALFDEFGEVKRMYVRPDARGTGVAPALLARLVDEARTANLAVVRLETGIRQPAAIRLYERSGFRACPPFGTYRSLPPASIETSLFYEKTLTPLEQPTQPLP